MVTAEILRTCTLTCQEGSIVEITEQQFRALGDAARELSDDVTITLLENPDTQETDSATAPESVEKSVENVENASETPGTVETAPETPEASLAPETPETKSKRRKKE